MYAYVVCPKSKCTDFLFNCLLDSHEITSYLLQSKTLGKLHSGSNISRNDEPSTSISTWGRGRNCTELDLGCRGDVEVRECFSLPKILELKAQCELACYRVTTPNRLQCPIGLAGPVFEVIPRHLCRRRD